MSASGREVAHRLFAAEYDDATHSYSESDEERAPNYVLTPTGARVNRVFFVGVLTAVESVSDDVLRARVADPTGVFVVYAGQYQPDEMAFLEDADPPLFVAVTGKARTFSPDGTDRVFTSVRPESINAVDADTRDRWTVQAAEATLARVATARAAMALELEGDALAAALAASGVPGGPAEGIPLAFDVYGTTEHYLAAVADLAIDALELVAEEADEVPGLTVTPDDAGDGTVDATALAAGLEGAVVDLVDPDAVAVDEMTSDEMQSSGGEGDLAESDDAGAAEPGDESPDVADAESEAAASDGEPTSPAEGTTDDGEQVDAERPADADEAEDLGDFEPGGSEPTQEGAADEMPADDVLDDEERERLEEEYGTFESGAEVDEPGSADIEPEAGPIEPDEGADAESEDAANADTEATETPETAENESPADGEPSDEASADEGTSEADADADDVDVEAAVMEVMTDLDDGDGADREDLVAAVVDEHGVDPGDVEAAIQEALMAGKCYEPDDAHVKPI